MNRKVFWGTLLVGSMFLVCFICTSIFPIVFSPREYSLPFEAASLGLADQLKPWLDKGGDPNAATESGLTLLDLATGTKGSWKAVALLLDYGANPNPRAIGDKQFSPLMRAAAEGNYTSVRCLVAHGADLNYKDNNGYSVIDIAVNEFSVEHDMIYTFIRSHMNKNNK